LLTSLYIFFRVRFTFFKKHNILHEKPSIPLGNLHQRLHLAEVFKEYYDKFKRKAPVFGFYFAINPGIVITDLNVVQDVLINKFDNFTNRGVFYNKQDDPLSAHLVSLEDEEWKNLRQKVIPFFSSHKMKMIFRTLLNVSDFMTDSLKSGKFIKIIEVKEMFIKYTIDVIGNVVYGIEMTAVNNPNSKFRKMGSILFDFHNFTFLKSIFMFCFVDLSKWLRLTIIPADMSEFFIGVVKTTVNYRLENKIERRDVIDILLSIESENEMKESKKLTVEEIAAQCFVFFLNGFETTSSTCTCVLYNLARNLDVQERVREEITMVLAGHENKVSYEAMEEMKYLQMVVDGGYGCGNLFKIF
jgi:cytochrome P450 family 6